MSRTPFAQFAKQFFESFLAPLGEVKVNFEVPGEPKFIDIWFSPSNQPNVEAQNLGILTQIAHYGLIAFSLHSPAAHHPIPKF